MAAKIDWKALDVVYAGSAPNPPRPTPMQDAVAHHMAALDKWDAAEERAAIMEYDGGLTRAKAEVQAFAKVKGICWWVAFDVLQLSH